jgi:hypothetical protein
MATEATTASQGLQLRKLAQLQEAVRAGRVAVLAASTLLLFSVLTVLVAAGKPTFLSAPVRSNYFPGWLAGPFGGLVQPAVSEATLKWAFSVGVLLAYGAYLLLIANYRTIGWRAVLALVVALQAIYLLGPPLALTDVFNYLNYARMEVVHHLNPYVTMPVLEPHNDPAFPLSNWHGLLSPYGPLFTIFTFAFARLSVAGYLWSYKAALVVADGLLLAFTAAAAKRLGRDRREALLWVGANPIVLVWGLGADHNDFFTMVLVVGGTYLLIAFGREGDEDRNRLLAVAVAGAVLALAAFFKASAGVMLPIALCALWSRRRLFKALLLGGAAGAVVGFAATLYAFGLHFPDITVQDTLVTGLSIPNLTGLALGQGGESHPIHVLFQVVLVAGILLSLYLAYRSRRVVEAAGWASFALVFTLSWVLPWYILWILPFCAMSGSRPLRRATVVLGLYLTLTWVPVSSQLFGAVGIHPGRTAVARANDRAVGELLNP